MNGSNKPDNFSPEEWKTLLNTPFIVFLATAAADGKVDAKEQAKFLNILTAAGKYKCDTLNQLLVEGIPHFSDFFSQLVGGKINPAEELMKATALIDSKLGAAEAQLLKISLLAIAREIAASSGGFLGLGSKISKDEERIIMGIGAIMKVT